jgi:hypothetical protein
MTVFQLLSVWTFLWVPRFGGITLKVEAVYSVTTNKSTWHDKTEDNHRQKMTAFCDIEPCSLSEVVQRFSDVNYFLLHRPVENSEKSKFQEKINFETLLKCNSFLNNAFNYWVLVYAIKCRVDDNLS